LSYRPSGQQGGPGNGVAAQAAHGTVALNPDGTFTYSPGATCESGGTDSFAYTVSDRHGGQATATVTITANKAVQDGAVTIDGSGVVRLGGSAGDHTPLLTTAGGLLRLHRVESGGAPGRLPA